MKDFMRTNPALKLFAILMIFLQVSCGAMSAFQRPVTMQDKIAYAEAGLTSSYKTITNLSVRGRLTKSEGIRFLSDADAVGTAIKATKSALTVGATSDATQALQMALDGLVALEAVLKAKEQS